MQFRVDVANRAHDAITLKRIDLQSIGEGAYNLPPISKPFNLAVNPGAGQSVDLWGPVYINAPTIVGPNGPVTLRVTVHYDTSAGPTQSVVVQQVHPFGQ